ncbi:cytochrome P450, partial [Vararia minispora EC-137]
VSAVFSGLFVAYVLNYYLRSSRRYLPPGPIGFPFVGNALSFLHKERFFTTCESYGLSPHLPPIFCSMKPSFAGDIVYVNLAGQPAVILNSQRVAADLLDRRAMNYSGRPRSIVASQLMCRGLHLALDGHTARWRRMRRAVHEAFGPSAAGSYHAMESEEAARLALAIAHDTQATTLGHYANHYLHFTASSILAITYDRPLRTAADEEIVKTVERMAAKLVHAATPGSHLADLFPWMLAIPDRFAKWKRDALAWHARVSDYFDGLVAEVKARMAKGEARSCLVRSLVEDKERFELSDAETSWAAGMIAAGVETQTMTFEWFTFAMVCHPDIQRRAQAELDAVIGRGRAPRVADRDHLPFLSALVREVLRWKPAAPLGVPHMSEEDDWYRGFFIPRGSLCIVNVRACHSDPEVYGEDAAQFNPRRHLDEKGQLRPAPADTKNEGHVGFGFGRRICVGRYVANDNLFAAMAAILWAFNLE